MASVSRTIHVEPDSDIAPLLDEAAKAPLLLDKDGAFYRLEAYQPSDDWNRYDPDKVMAALDEVVGIISTVEADALIADLYHAREEGSRPASQPE